MPETIHEGIIEGELDVKLILGVILASFLVIMLVAAIITPPDLLTLVLVTIPLYLLFEVSIRVVRLVEK